MPAPKRTIPKTNQSNELVLSEKGQIRQTAPQEQTTVFLQQPQQDISHDLSSMKFQQVIMIGIGFLFIWGGIFSVAFDEQATNQNFLVLFVGGLASFGVALGMIEMQSKRNDYQLMDMQNYILGTAFFFSTVGVLWGTRFLMGFLTDTFDLSWFGNPNDYTTIDWSPNENGIYAQTITCGLLTFVHFKLLHRFKGATSFGWGVATYAPIVILLAGAGPWIRWSGDLVSYELGLSMILLSIISMEMAIQSNKSFNFGVVAFIAGCIPIMYEILNTNAPRDGVGGSISLLVFIVCIQGYYAAKEEIRQPVMERTTLFLILQVMLAMLLFRDPGEYHLILGPLTPAAMSSVATYWNIPTMLWCAVLLAYFPAVLKNRVPWMPIGLACALVLMPSESSVLTWGISMLILPYMIFVSKVARQWAIQATLIAFGLSYWLKDVYGVMTGISAADSFGGHSLEIILPVYIVILTHFAKQYGKIDTPTLMVMFTFILLSRAILDPVWYLPWLFIGYMMFQTIEGTKIEDIGTRKRTVTLSSLFTSITLLVLISTEQLKFPEVTMVEPLRAQGYYIELTILAIAFYGLSTFIRDHEFDLGSINEWTSQGHHEAPRFNSQLGLWEVPEKHEESQHERIERIMEAEWTPLSRISLITSLAIFAFNIAYLERQTYANYPLVMLFLSVPIGILVHEILRMEIISSMTRAAGAGILLAIAIPVSLPLKLFSSPDLINEGLSVPNLLLDAILMLAPIIVSVVISRKGIDDEQLNEKADALALGFLLILALLDTSGGLLLVPLTALVSYRAIKHGHKVVAASVPLAYILSPTRWYEGPGVADTILTALPSNIQTYFLSSHSGFFSALVAWIIVIQSLSFIFLDRSLKTQRSLKLEHFVSIFWLVLALFSIIPDGFWLPLIVVYTLLFRAWYSSSMTSYPPLLVFTGFAWLIGISTSSTFEELSAVDMWSYATLATGSTALAFLLLDRVGMIVRMMPDEADDSVPTSLHLIMTLCFVASFTTLFGFVPLLGLFLSIWSFKRYPILQIVLFYPLLFVIGLTNIVYQNEVSLPFDLSTFVGILLAITGFLYTELGKKEDFMFDLKYFDWKSDEQFFKTMDELGFIGTLYCFIGFLLMATTPDFDTIAFFLMTIYCVLIGLHGFQDEEGKKWNRTLGGYGSIFSGLAFTFSIESAIFKGLSFVFVGILAMGFGFLFMQRMEQGTVLEPSSATSSQSVVEPPYEVAAPTLESDHIDSNESIEIDEEDPTPVKKSDEKMKQTSQFKSASSNQVSPSIEPKQSQNPAEHTTPVPNDIGLLMTQQGFAIRLPNDAVQNIKQTIEHGNFGSFLPVVTFSPQGEIILKFEPI